jgi:hypothetical protein
MKCNAHLYLPWSVIAELVASTGAQLSKAKSDRPRVPVASAESLDGGCVLYRLTDCPSGIDERISSSQRQVARGTGRWSTTRCQDHCNVSV